MPTIENLVSRGAKVILCSHLGKPKGEPKPELSLSPVAKKLSEMLGKEVVFAADERVVGDNANAAVANMKDGDIVEQGNHNELLAANGFYANLYNSQFEDIKEDIV